MGEFDIALVGMAGIFPNADSVDELWEALNRGEDMITRSYGEREERKDYVSAYGKIRGAYQFDPGFFGIHNIEAMDIDPQERKLLETAYHAIEAAGVTIDPQENHIGFICGIKENEYALKKYYEKFKNRFEMETSKLYNGALAASRIAYKLNLQGPCYQVKATCATAIVGIDQAIHILRQEQADLMLVGTANLSLEDEGYARIDGGITSQDGYGRALSEEATGCVPGDGVGVIVLKRLADAVRDKDQIWSVIAGCAIENDGNRKIGFMAPSIQGEMAAIKKAQAYIENAKAKIRYIETHGTGTKLGDRVEIRALNNVFQGQKDIVLGAVKNNIGHLNYAAGMVGVLKTARILSEGKIPPVIHCDPSSKELKNSPFRLNKEIVKLPREENYAAVSSFGIGGVNTHLIMKSYNHLSETTNIPAEATLLLPISAKTEKALVKYQEVLEQLLRTQPEKAADIAFTLTEGRNHYQYRNFWLVSVHDGQLHIQRGETRKVSEEELEENFSVASERKLSSGFPEKEDLRLVALQWQEGKKLVFKELYPMLESRKTVLPGYCFEKKEFNYFDKDKILAEPEIEEIKKIEILYETNLAFPQMEDFPGLETVMEKIPLQAAIHYAVQNGIKANNTYRLDELLQTMGVIPEYRDFARYLLGILEKNGLAQIRGEDLFVYDLGEDLFHCTVESASKAFSEFEKLFQFTEHCVEEYTAVFTGKKIGNHVLYPNGDYQTILEIGNSIPDITRKQIYRQAFPAILKHLMDKRRKESSTIRILEIGGGIGLLTWILLEHLKEIPIEYYFTDIGSSFLANAKRKAQEGGYENFHIHKFNLDIPLEEQGLEGGSFDYVVGLEVLQVSKNIRSGLDNIGGLLKENGVLAMMQAFHSSEMNYLCYGYAPGWWNYEEDAVRKGKNIMPSMDALEFCLKDSGYRDCVLLADSKSNIHKEVGIVLAVNTKRDYKETATLKKIAKEKVWEISEPDGVISQLLQMVEDVIGERVTPEDDLFERGLDSLSVLILSARIKESYGIEIGIDSFYDYGMVGALADLINKGEAKEVKRMDKEEVANLTDINNLLSELDGE